MTLENVRIKVEAFEYLQLPINITEGCIGHLVVQVTCFASDIWACHPHLLTNAQGQGLLHTAYVSLIPRPVSCMWSHEYDFTRLEQVCHRSDMCAD